MSFLIIEIFLCIGFVFILYQCCIRGARRAQRQLEQQNGYPESEDLRRFRERMSERADEARRNNNASASERLAARKELIEKNLFQRRITREESVRELARLLAISRGNQVDEELGRCDVPPARAASGGVKGAAQSPDGDIADIHPTVTASVSEDSALPSPSAPPQSREPSASRVTDNVATAMSTAPTTEPQSADGGPDLMEPIRNLWTNLTHPLADVATTATSPASQTNVCTLQPQKLECSICLEHYSPDDTVAWAKDGGDPPTLSTVNAAAINNDQGCDHIFHRECLVAWLEDHDECPLCRRKVVHADAEVRFAGWDR